MAGDPLAANLHRFVLYTLTSSSAGWDTGRALTNGVTIVLAGPAVLTALRRASRRAAFDVPVVFEPSAGQDGLVQPGLEHLDCGRDA